jgi:hypothetical protein
MKLAASMSRAACGIMRDAGLHLLAQTAGSKLRRSRSFRLKKPALEQPAQDSRNVLFGQDRRERTFQIGNRGCDRHGAKESRQIQPADESDGRDSARWLTTGRNSTKSPTAQGAFSILTSEEIMTR